MAFQDFAGTDHSAREDDDRVLSFREWCAKAGVSEATGRRLVARGEGPTITQVSVRRVGITGRHHREWLDRRTAIRGENDEQAKLGIA
jgi:predicted DNA-binding transcriptional regulator AlpA